MGEMETEIKKLLHQAGKLIDKKFPTECENFWTLTPPKHGEESRFHAYNAIIFALTLVYQLIDTKSLLHDGDAFWTTLQELNRNAYRIDLEDLLCDLLLNQKNEKS